MEALAFGVILIGLSGALKGEKTLVMILSLAVGAAIGATVGIDDAFHRLADKLSGKLVGPDRQAGFAAGFVSASLLFCIPSRRGLTPRGSLECNPEIPAFPGEEY